MPLGAAGAFSPSTVRVGQLTALVVKLIFSQNLFKYNRNVHLGFRLVFGNGPLYKNNEFTYQVFN